MKRHWRECAGLAGASVAVAILDLTVWFTVPQGSVPFWLGALVAMVVLYAGLRTGKALYDWRHRER